VEWEPFLVSGRSPQGVIRVDRAVANGWRHALDLVRDDPRARRAVCLVVSESYPLKSAELRTRPCPFDPRFLIGLYERGYHLRFNHGNKRISASIVAWNSLPEGWRSSGPRITPEAMPFWVDYEYVGKGSQRVSEAIERKTDLELVFLFDLSLEGPQDPALTPVSSLCEMRDRLAERGVRTLFLRRLMDLD
jgi:hypothetical protein